ELVAKEALVAQPDIIHLGVLTGAGARDGLAADVERGRAPASAVRAHTPRGAIVPRPRPKAVGGAGQRADRTDLHRVPDELAVDGLGERRPDLAVVAALEPLQRVIPGNDLAEPHAPPAEDAPLAVEDEHRPHADVLAKGALGFNEPPLPRPKLERVVLQRALAALVADRAVQRVVHQQELEDALLAGLHALGLRAHDHVFADLLRAGGDQLRHLLDLHEAHAARPERRHP